MPRHHAEYIVQEEAVRAVFQRHCSNVINDPFSGRWALFISRQGANMSLQ